jgi:nucleolar complex protein 2
MELSKLAEKDPEFYKYLQENDRELLEFDLNGAEEDEDDDMADIDEDGHLQRAPALTMDILRKWQKALLQVGVHRLYRGEYLTDSYISNGH